MTVFSHVDRFEARFLRVPAPASRGIARHSIDLPELARRVRATVIQALLVGWMLLALAAWGLLLAGFLA